MITTGSKYLYGSALLALVGAFFLAISTSGHAIGMSTLLGAISLGYKGPVGNHFAYAVLVAYAGMSLFVGGVLTAVRDGDPEAGAQIQGLAEPAAVLPVRGVNHWPLIAAFGVAVALLGVIFEPVLFILGAVLVTIAAFEWMIYSWAEDATGDATANRKVRNRLLNPIEIPLFAIMGIALFVFAFSRVLLALDKVPGAIIFGIVPLIAFVVVILLNSKPTQSKNVIAVLVVLGGILILASGVAGLVHGRQDVEHEQESPHEYTIKGQHSSAPRLDIRIAGEESR
jgi:hypothetical protein